jgi:hypothetical protein
MVTNKERWSLFFLYITKSWNRTQNWFLPDSHILVTSDIMTNQPFPDKHPWFWPMSKVSCILTGSHNLTWLVGISNHARQTTYQELISHEMYATFHIHMRLSIHFIAARRPVCTIYINSSTYRHIYIVPRYAVACRPPCRNMQLEFTVNPIQPHEHQLWKMKMKISLDVK